MSTACCGRPVDYDTAQDFCETCGADLCSRCAAKFEREDGYGDDGREVRTHALCHDCKED